MLLAILYAWTQEAIQRPKRSELDGEVGWVWVRRMKVFCHRLMTTFVVLRQYTPRPFQLTFTYSEAWKGHFIVCRFTPRSFVFIFVAFLNSTHCHNRLVVEDQPNERDTYHLISSVNWYDVPMILAVSSGRYDSTIENMFPETEWTGVLPIYFAVRGQSTALNSSFSLKTTNATN